MTEFDRHQLEVGRLSIETANFVVDARMAREGDLTVGEYVSLSVSDTGTGMTPEVAARAFDPFFTTKPLGSGTVEPASTNG